LPLPVDDIAFDTHHAGTVAHGEDRAFAQAEVTPDDMPTGMALASFRSSGQGFMPRFRRITRRSQSMATIPRESHRHNRQNRRQIEAARLVS
jgi:hypothetical protein